MAYITRSGEGVIVAVASPDRSTESGVAAASPDRSTEAGVIVAKASSARSTASSVIVAVASPDRSTEADSKPVNRPPKDVMCRALVELFKNPLEMYPMLKHGAVFCHTDEDLPIFNAFSELC